MKTFRVWYKTEEKRRGVRGVIESPERFTQIDAETSEEAKAILAARSTPTFKYIIYPCTVEVIRVDVGMCTPKKF